jgi:hypothetical protein
MTVAGAALIVAISSALVAAIGVWFGKRSADAAISIERERRHAEIRPRYLVTLEAPSPGTEQRHLLVKLIGPGELETIDRLGVTIRDYSYFRLKPPGSAPDEVWGPLRFVPGTGPGFVATRSRAGVADRAGRTTTSAELIPVGEEHKYALEPTSPPDRTSLSRDLWLGQVGATLKLRIETGKSGWDPWVAAAELGISNGPVTSEVT